MIDGVLAILATSAIWGWVILYYKWLMKNEDHIALNLQRFIAALTVSIPIILFKWDSRGFHFSLLSGALGLGLGDTLYLFAIRKAGATIAAPVAYTYIVISQGAAILFNESVGHNVLIASLLVFMGIRALSIDRDKKAGDAVGVLAAFMAGITWTLSAVLIKKAVTSEAPIYMVSFFRLIGGILILYTYVLVKNRRLRPPTVQTVTLYPVAFIDIFLGAALYAFSVKKLGISLTVILVSLSPVFTQILSRLMKIEPINKWKMIGTGLIIGGAILSQL